MGSIYKNPESVNSFILETAQINGSVGALFAGFRVFALIKNPPNGGFGRTNTIGKRCNPCWVCGKRINRKPTLAKGACIYKPKV